ncbi:enoyl-CoA hydratase/isomerase family protein [Bacillus mangrovi]|uniref:Enoyl-CoA hydratase/isomerase family protein n=1 Tax=Metabacillus mangrovi TaxID=1491830 RepID=A0A7X2V3Q8_9BACI|nr:enoyl-CoA hydratase/isomerase family protein [Metabacillus mangrovi]MTH52620.1 enoyl-CoA hydratase/isomerase family protein [Metabacillus mangrovi]
MGRNVQIENAGDGIVTVSLDRPEKRNAVNFEVMDELEAFLDKYEADETVRALILTGSGERAFCSGGDLTAFHSLRTEKESYEMLHRMGEILYRLSVFPAPVFALINGTAIGGGCELAMAADRRIAKEGVQLGFIQGSLSITTGWGGGALLMERTLPQNALKVLCSAARYPAEACKDLGLVDEILPAPFFKEEAVRIIKEQLAENPSVTRAYKSVWIRKLAGSGLRERMEEEIRQCARLWEKEEHHQAVQTFINRKKESSTK